MSESQSHKKAKKKAAGSTGKTEVPISGGRRLDAKTPFKATEVERSGDLKRLGFSAKKLKDSAAKQKVLQVPQKDMDKAIQAMKDAGVSGTVKNMSGSKTKRVK